MPVFFNGRLLTTPTVETLVNDGGLAPQSSNIGNVLTLVGISDGGIPKQPTVIRSVAHARQVLRSGELLFACEKALAPSADTNAPGVLMIVRANPAVQATLTLKDANDDDALVLQSTDYGAHTNGIQIKIEAGSLYGKKVTTRQDGRYFTGDNLQRSLLTLAYTGAGTTAKVTVTATQVSLQIDSADPTVIALAEYPTVRRLVERLSSEPDWTVTMTPGAADLAALNAIDGLTDANGKAQGGVILTGNLQVIIDWINSAAEDLVTATRAVAAVAVPANLPYTYLGGGSNGAATNQDWDDAFEALEAEDTQWIVPLSASSAVWGLADTHCQYMSTVGRKERRCFVGNNTGLSAEQATADAQALNSDRTAYVYPGFYDYNANGVLTLMPAYLLAAMVGAAFAALTPGEPMTNKSLRIRGLETLVAMPSDTDYLIRGGVLAVYQNARGGYRVAKSISTWQNNQNYNRIEISTGFALDYVVRTVRERMELFIGRKGTYLSLQAIVEEAAGVLRTLAQAEPYGLGLLAGDSVNPPFRNLTAAITGDIVQLEFECSPVIPINYILVSVYANAYAGTYSAI